MKSKNYIAPCAMKHTTGLRMSILAGSSTTTNKIVTGRDFDFGARQRNINSSISNASID